VTWNSEAERQLLAQSCLRHFEPFVRTGLGFTHPKNNKGGWWTPGVHDKLCHWFEGQCREWLATRHKTPEKRFLAVMLPRNCAKSLLIATAGMTWLQLQDPNISAAIGNEKLPLATEFLDTIKSWLEGRGEYNLFEWLYGNWVGEARKWRSESIAHAARTQQGPSFRVWSPSSSLTGRHPDVLCMDDLVSYEALETDKEWFETAYAHMTDLIPVMEPNGLFILNGTRYSDADPFGRSFKDDGIASLAGMTDAPEYQPNGGLWHVFFISGRDAAGRPTIPTVWSDRAMKLMERRDPIKLAAQIYNRPQQHALRPLTELEFNAQLTDALPKKAFATFHLDTAFKSVRKMTRGSETALVIALHDQENQGHVTVVEALADPAMHSDTYADLLIEQFKVWKDRFPVIAFTDEPEMAGKLGTWPRYLQDRFTDAGLFYDFPAFYQFNRQAGEKKEVRITNSLAFLKRGQIKVHKDCRNLDALRYQLCQHPNAFPNDLADAFADIVNPEFFVGLLPTLVEKAKGPEYGAYEERLKGPWLAAYDKIDFEQWEYDRPPIRRAAPVRSLPWP
jgi:hypothetical protein